MDFKELFKKLDQRISEARNILGRPLTLTEKILFSHLDSSTPLLNTSANDWVRGINTIKTNPDRVAMQDATAQMAMLQFMSAQKDLVAVPSSIHCDHLISAQSGAIADLERAIEENKEVYDFLSQSSDRYGIDFWKPGSGIIHQVVLENYAFPGGLIIGTDSHTPNAGGLGMLAIGVGGADAAEVMTGLPWGVTLPKIVGIHLKGALKGWTAPKDIILKVASILTVEGGTGKIIEYFGDGVKSISCTGRATVTNMGAELGATTSVFQFDQKSIDYLKATDRTDLAEISIEYLANFSADKECLENPAKFYDELYEIDLNTLEPHIVGPHTPDLARPISKMKEAVKNEGYPDDLRYALIGSCTNSSYEDIYRSASIAENAAKAGLKAKIPFMITPGSEAVYATIERDGLLDKLTAVGGVVLANACGPCIGQWDRTDIKPGEANSILTSFNRNFKKRNDGNSATMAFIASPEIVTAIAFAGSLSFNPIIDELTGSDGTKFKLDVPQGKELPEAGLKMVRTGLQKSSGSKKEVFVEPHSDRIALLEPFSKWDGKDITDVAILVKAKGKCTTDHISPAGPWLKYRGHLDRISDNMYSGAINAFTGEAGKGTNQLNGTKDEFSKIARNYKTAKLGWVAIGDDNYGEGSSREHAAMSPRFLGCRAVIAKSFARIAETNLKKQGLLGLKFENPADYDLLHEKDRLSILGLEELKPNSKLLVEIYREKKLVGTFEVSHTFDAEQIGWFKAGSALNSL